MKIILIILLCLTFPKAESYDSLYVDIQKALAVMDEPYKVDFLTEKPKQDTTEKDHTAVQIIGVSALILFVSIFLASYDKTAK